MPTDDAPAPGPDPRAPAYGENIASLRGEWNALRQEIRRFCLLVVVVLFTAYLMADRAHRSIVNEEVQAKVDRVHALGGISDQPPDLPDFIGMYVRPQGDPGKRGDTPEARESARLELNALTAELDSLEAEAGRQLLVDYRLWGVTIPLDLRDFLVLIPVILVVSLAYVAILLQKRDGVERLLARRVSGARPHEPTDLDRLQFTGGAPGAHARHPAQLLAGVFVCTALIVGTAMVAMALPMARHLTDGINPEDDRLFLWLVVAPVAQGLALLVCYAVSYAALARREIRRQHRRLHGVYPRERRVPVVLAQLAHAWAALRRRGPGRPALPGGTALGMATLFVLIAATTSQCDPTVYRTGLELLTLPEADWYTATLSLVGVNEGWAAVGWGVYAFFLAATLTGLLAAFGAYLPRRVAAALARVLAVSFLAVVLFLTADFGLSLGLLTPLMPVPKLLLWTLPLACAAFLDRRRARVTPSRRVAWLLVYPPLALSGFLFLGLLARDEPRVAFGLGVYWLAAALLWLGWRHRARAWSRPARPAGARRADATRTAGPRPSGVRIAAPPEPVPAGEGAGEPPVLTEA